MGITHDEFVYHFGPWEWLVPGSQSDDNDDDYDGGVERRRRLRRTTASSRGTNRVSS